MLSAQNLALQQALVMAGLDTQQSALLMDQLSDAVIITDRDFHVEEYNSAAAFYYGHSRTDILGKNIIVTAAYTFQHSNFEKVRLTLAENGNWSGKTTFLTNEGVTLRMFTHIAARRNENNLPEGYLILNKPIQNRRQSDALLRDLVRRKPFINALAEGLIVHDEAGEIIICNKMAELISGLTKEQMNDRRYLETQWRGIHEDGSLFNWDTFPSIAAFHTGKPQKNIVMGFEKANGSRTWINVNSHPVFNETHKNVIGVVTSFTDITEIRSTQEQLRSSEEKWRSVLNNNKNGVFLLDRDYRILLVNDDGRKMHLLMPDLPEIRENQIFLDILPDSRRAAVKEILERVFQGELMEYEIVYSRTDDEDLWLLVNYAPIKDHTDYVHSICISVNNVTRVKRNEAALRKSEQRWKFALDGAGDGVWEYNFQTRESYYSPLYKTMLGYTEEEFKNEAFEWHTRVHPDDLYKITDIDKLYENGEIENHSLEYRLRSKSGEYIWVLDRGMLLERTHDGKPLKLIGTHKNINEQVLREEKLIQSRRRFSSFMANTPTMTWIIDENAVFRYLNTPYMKAFNLTEQHIGKSIYDIFPEHICNTFVQNNWKVWEDGRAMETIEEGVSPDGSKQLYQIFKFPLETENGVRMLGGVALDITQKVRLEKQLAEEQEKKKREIILAIMNAQEKERKELAYELHDNVNQILSSSRLMLEVAVEKPEMSAPFVQRSLNYLQDAIAELRKISHSLIPGTLRDISLEAAIEEVVQNINATEKLKISYSKKIDSWNKNIVPEIQLAVLRIAQEQVGNILKHAAASNASLSLLIGEEVIALTVEDNGCGFDTVITKRGLGLNNIFNRTEYYHGHVQLTSSPGNGCTLHIEIPI